MKRKQTQVSLWVAVKVERGFISEARLFGTPGQAQRSVRGWQTHLNPDYDEAAVVRARVSADLLRTLPTVV